MKFGNVDDAVLAGLDLRVPGNRVLYDIVLPGRLVVALKVYVSGY
jgi:hypothetical protein